MQTPGARTCWASLYGGSTPLTSVSDAARGHATQSQNVAVSIVGRFSNRFVRVSFCESLPLSALESPPFAIFEIAEYVYPASSTASSSVSMGFFDTGESGNQFFTKRFKAGPGKIGVSER